jgi:hypothetical protein
MNKRSKLAALIAIPAALAVGLFTSLTLFAPGMFGEAAGARNGLDRFLARVLAEDWERAYREAAPELRCRMTLDAFRADAIARKLGALRPADRISTSLPRSWPRIAMADIDVSVPGAAPLHAAVLKSDGVWRVAWVDRMPVASVQTQDRKCGDRSMHIAMIRTPLRDLVQGLDRRDFAALARRFQPSRAVTPEALAATYAALAPRAAALKEALRAEPVFAPDPGFTDGAWQLQGFVSAGAERFAFRADLKIDGDWKLMRFDVDAVSAPN